MYSYCKQNNKVTIGLTSHKCLLEQSRKSKKSKGKYYVWHFQKKSLEHTSFIKECNWSCWKVNQPCITYHFHLWNLVILYSVWQYYVKDSRAMLFMVNFVCQGVVKYHGKKFCLWQNCLISAFVWLKEVSTSCWSFKCNCFFNLNILHQNCANFFTAR